jgi:hypothetical protein
MEIFQRTKTKFEGENGLFTIETPYGDNNNIRITSVLKIFKTNDEIMKTWYFKIPCTFNRIAEELMYRTTGITINDDYSEQVLTSIHNEIKRFFNAVSLSVER